MKTIYLALLIFTSIFALEEVQNSKLSDGVDLSNYQEIHTVDTKIIFDTNSSKSDGIYNFDYNVNSLKTEKETNVFLDGNFDKIHRYEALYFRGSSLENDSNENFNEITKQIHKYTDDKSREIVVSILGYTQKVENENEEISTGSAYTNFFQNIAQRDDLNPKSASAEAVNFIEIVYKKMRDNNISKEIIYKESCIGKGTLYTEEFSKARALNNRVDIAIYVKNIPDPDTDKDGVHDSKDYCPQTPIGAHVDKNGCPLVMSLDLLFDFDQAKISDEISLKNIQKLSDFMKKYPAYHANIVGHTDSDGNAKYNQKLSIKRAKVVKLTIVADGVKPERLSFEGRGESEPLFENINPFNRHKNRRTEVELTLPKQESMQIKPLPRSRGFKD